jgi:hypothetical protein
MTTDPQPDRDYLTLDHLVIPLLVVECALWLSDRPGWPAEWETGHAVLAAVLSVGFVLFLTLLWYTVALLLSWPFQFGIRSLLLLVVAVAAPFSWLAVEIQRTQREREVVVGIEQLGGQATYDWQVYGWNGAYARDPAPGPAWLRSILGDYFFGTVRRVSLNAHCDDAELERLAGLRKLQEVDIVDSKVTDAGIAKLQNALPNCKIIR